MSTQATTRVFCSVVKTSRLFEQIAQQIEESILTGFFGPGDRLPSERDLAQRFGASRTVIREAVKALSEKGLVQARSSQGTFVSDDFRKTGRK